MHKPQRAAYSTTQAQASSEVTAERRNKTNLFDHLQQKQEQTVLLMHILSHLISTGNSVI